MKATVKTATIGSMRAAKVTAADVRVGAVHIGKVALRDLHVDYPEGSVELRGLHVTVDLNATLEIRVELPGFHRTARFEQGPFHLSLLQRDIAVPLPKGIRGLRVEEIETTGVSAQATTVKPEVPLDLGRLVASTITLVGLSSEDAPAPPAGPLDLGDPGPSIGSLAIEGVHAVDDGLVPLGPSQPARPRTREVAADAVTLQTTTLGSLPIPHLTIAGPSAARGELSPVVGEKVAIDGPAAYREWSDDDGALRSKLALSASARLEIDSVEIRLAADVGLGSIELSDVLVPLTLDNLCLSDLGFSDIDVSRIDFTSSPKPKDTP